MKKLYYSPEIKIEILEAHDVLLLSDIDNAKDALGNMSSLAAALFSGALISDDD